MKNDLSKGSEKPHHLPEALLQKFLSNQEKEIELKAQELTLRTQSDANSYNFSSESLKLNAQDRKEHRAFLKDSARDKYFFIGALFIVIVLLIGFALYLNKDQIAIEIIKALIYLSAGAAGGYGYGRMKNNSKQQD